MGGVQDGSREMSRVSTQVGHDGILLRVDECADMV